MDHRPAVGLGMLVFVLSLPSPPVASNPIEDPCAEARSKIEARYHAWQGSTPTGDGSARAAAQRNVDLFRRKEVALGSRFGVSLHPDEIVAERIRIETDSHRPDRLRELYEALGNDRWLVEQCLVRPLLVERRFTEAWSARVVASADDRPWQVWLDAEVPDAPVPPRRRFDDRLLQVPEAGGTTIGDSWQPISSIGAPSPRTQPRLLWTGALLVVWGGAVDGTVLADGGRYDPVLDTWSPVSLVGAPSTRYGFVAEWMGSEVVVWGGYNQGYLGDGARYDPISDTWTPMSSSGAPQARVYASAVRVDDSLYIVGGDAQSSVIPQPGFYACPWTSPPGGRYLPAADQWLSGTGHNGAGPAVAWTGAEIFMAGGTVSQAAELPLSIACPYQFDRIPAYLYDPATDQLRSGGLTPLGGYISGGPGPSPWIPPYVVSLRDRLRYDVDADEWRFIAIGGVSSSATTVAMPTGVIAWGDYQYPNWVPAGSIYFPVCDAWFAISAQDGPAGVRRGAGAWIGDATIFWGGLDGAGNAVNSGAIYDPGGYLDDADGDLAPDVCDPCVYDAQGSDNDNDGVVCELDNCPVTANPSQSDLDGDGAGDACDPCPNDADDDGDDDGFCGDVDNCPTVPNSAQVDTDGDSVGDLCDNCIAVVNKRQHDLDDPGQWAVSAIASSEWSTTDYSAMQATGSPESAGQCADVATNWSPLTSGSGPEWLELTYAAPVQAIGVVVHETLLGSFVTGIDLIEPDGTPHTLTLPADTTACGDTLSPTFATTSYLVDKVRVTTQVAEWEEIDAVQLIAAGPDGLGDACDVCPDLLDPSQVDSDGDGRGDLCDCAPADPAVRMPGAIDLTASIDGPGSIRLDWAAPVGADRYTVLRGRLNDLPAGDYGSCFAQDLNETTVSDSFMPVPGEGMTYLVVPESLSCGVAGWGVDASGADRGNTNPWTCLPAGN